MANKKRREPNEPAKLQRDDQARVYDLVALYEWIAQRHFQLRRGLRILGALGLRVLASPSFLVAGSLSLSEEESAFLSEASYTVDGNVTAEDLLPWILSKRRSYGAALRAMERALLKCTKRSVPPWVLWEEQFGVRASDAEPGVVAVMWKDWRDDPEHAEWVLRSNRRNAIAESMRYTVDEFAEYLALPSATSEADRAARLGYCVREAWWAGTWELGSRFRGGSMEPTTEWTTRVREALSSEHVQELRMGASESGAFGGGPRKAAVAALADLLETSDSTINRRVRSARR